MIGPRTVPPSSAMKNASSSYRRTNITINAFMLTGLFYDVDNPGQGRRSSKKAVGKGPLVPYLHGVSMTRKYRRRRVVAALLAVVAAVALYAGTRAEAGQPHGSYTVAPGDTLWSVAIKHYPPSEDPRVAVEAVRKVNGIEDYRIRPGERLEIPHVET